MKLAKVMDCANKMGDFYLHYLKYDGKRTTYLVGTAEFDNRYIIAMAKKQGSGLPKPLTGDVLFKLNAAAESAKAADKILVFSWTNNKFRTIPAGEVRRLSPLQTEIRNSGRRKR